MSGNVRQFLVKYGYFWQFMTTSGNVPQCLPVSGTAVSSQADTLWDVDKKRKQLTYKHSLWHCDIVRPKWGRDLLINTLCLLSSPNNPHILVVPRKLKFQIRWKEWKYFPMWDGYNFQEVTSAPLTASPRSSSRWERWPLPPNPDPSFQTL